MDIWIAYKLQLDKQYHKAKQLGAVAIQEEVQDHIFILKFESTELR